MKKHLSQMSAEEKKLCREIIPPSKRVSLSRHAKRRRRDRGIDNEEISYSIDHPQKVLEFFVEPNGDSFGVIIRGVTGLCCVVDCLKGSLVTMWRDPFLFDQLRFSTEPYTEELDIQESIDRAYKMQEEMALQELYELVEGLKEKQ